MRLSDVKGERTLEVFADIVEPIANIAQDEEASVLFKPKALPEGMTPTEFMLERIKTSLPVLLKNHKRDILIILSSIEGTPLEEYTKSFDLKKLIKDCTELFTDELFSDLFISAQSIKQ